MKSQFNNLKGNEHTGTEVCLYIIDKLVSGYTFGHMNQKSL